MELREHLIIVHFQIIVETVKYLIICSLIEIALKLYFYDVKNWF